MKVWDTETNQQIGRSRVIPLECGDIDVRMAMEEAIKAQNVEVRPAVVSACTMQAVPACMHACDRLRIEHRVPKSLIPNLCCTFPFHPMFCSAWVGWYKYNHNYGPAPRRVT